VAVIGASKDPSKWGNLMSKSIIESGYAGKIYLVNPKGGQIYGRKTYPSLFDIEDFIDLAIIGIPSKLVPDAVSDCVERGIRGIIIVTAHFGEYSEDGKKVEAEILEMARKGGTRIVGPNCMGIYNASINLNTTFASFLPGPYALISQSGNLGLELDYLTKKRGLGFSKWVSLGNQLDIPFHEYLSYVKDDADTKVILTYIEGLKEGRDFLSVARETTKSKPVLSVKVGASPAGARAAASHTGALAGGDQIYDSAFRQVGIIRVNNSDELLDVGEALLKCPLPRGNRIAILVDGGGAGTLAADISMRYNLEVPILSEETQENLAKVMPTAGLHSLTNPIDFATEVDIRAWARFSKIILQDEGIDGLVLVGGYGGYTDAWPAWDKAWVEMAYEISRLPRELDKPLIVQSMFHGDNPKSLEVLSQQGIPVYGSLETAMKCMSHLAGRRRYLDKLEEEYEPPRLVSGDLSAVKSIIKSVRDSGRLNLLETEAREILKAYGLPVSKSKLVRDEGEAIKITEEMQCPLAMKIVSPDIIHKSDAACVKLHLKDRDDVVKAFSEIIANARGHIREAEIYGVICTPMEAKGVEVIVGMTKDRTFGPTVMFGLGGIFVEVLRDISFRVAPVTRKDAYEMIKEIEGFPILSGVRGQKGISIDAIVDVIMKISILVIENPEISELDLNPVFVYEDRASVIDARIILA
jgi:acetyltransferase